MSTAAAALHAPTRDPFMPRRPPGMRVGLALALLAHALLIAGLAFSVDWHSTPQTAVEAELWSALPQQAAPRAVEPPPQPQQAARPAPPPPPEPARPQTVQPPPPPQVDPQIATEKARQAKQAQADRELAEQQDVARREKTRRDQARQTEIARQQAERDRQQAKEQQSREEQVRKQQLADKAEKAQKADKEKADREKVDKEKSERTALATQQAAARAAYLKRIQGLAGASGDSNATGTAARSSGPSSSYGGRIMARVRPNIIYPPDANDGNPTASVEVRVAPDGTITSRRLLQGSGVKSWDDAVLRAIDRTDGLPRDIDGRVPPVIVIDFKPRS